VREAGVRRLLVVGGAGGLEVAPDTRLVDTPDFPADWKPEAIAHTEALDYYRSVEDLDWTFVSPAAFIHPGERTGRYRLGGDQLLVDDNGNSEVSAEDYAIAIADLLETVRPRARTDHRRLVTDPTRPLGIHAESAALAAVIFGAGPRASGCHELAPCPVLADEPRMRIRAPDQAERTPHPTDEHPRRRLAGATSRTIEIGQLLRRSARARPARSAAV